MGLFRRRKEEPQPADRIEWVTSTARRILAERGIETTIQHGAQPEAVTLIATDSQVYPLFNAFAKTHGATAEQARLIITEHIDNLLDSRGTPSPTDLSADELRTRVRTRILPRGDDRPNEPTFHYARPFAEGLILALCVDFPTTVSYINDAHVDKLALGMDELYVFGQLNTDQEPVDERIEPVPAASKSPSPLVAAPPQYRSPVPSPVDHLATFRAAVAEHSSTHLTTQGGRLHLTGLLWFTTQPSGYSVRLLEEEATEFPLSFRREPRFDAGDGQRPARTALLVEDCGAHSPAALHDPTGIDDVALALRTFDGLANC